MSIQAKVVNKFKEKEHEDHVYHPGDPYPAEGFEATPERVEFLSQVHPVHKKIYLADVVDTDKEENSSGDDGKKDADDTSPDNDGDENTEYPKHTGGAWYELSNGEKVQGKEEAFAAEEALKAEE